MKTAAVNEKQKRDMCGHELQLRFLGLAEGTLHNHRFRTEALPYVKVGAGFNNLKEGNRITQQAVV